MCPLPALLSICLGVSSVGLCDREGIEVDSPAQPYIALVWNMRICRVHVLSEQALLPKISNQKLRMHGHLK